MKSSFFIFVAAGAATTAALVFACGNSGNTNDQADGSGGDATVSTQDGQASNDGGTRKDGAGSDGSATDGSSADGASDAGIACTGGGVLDPTFGDGGAAWYSFMNAAGSVVRAQSDGKLVLGGSVGPFAGGSLALLRLNSDGSIDSNFGDAGLVTTALGKGTPTAVDLKLQSDGKVLAASTAVIGNATDFAIFRYEANGSLDTTFGDGGIVVASYGSTSVPYSLAVTPDGHVLVSGVNGLANSDAGTDYAVARFNSDGTVDTAFGDGGTVTIDVRSSEERYGSIALEADGKIVVGGSSSEEPARDVFDLSIVRLSAVGALDSTFGVNGKAVSAFDGYYADWQGGSLAIDFGGRPIVIGVADNASASDFAVARATTAGIFDTSFGDGGVATTDFSGRNDGANGVVVQPDGKVLVVGASVTLDSTSSEVAIARYLPSGVLDPQFGVGGELVSNFPIGGVQTSTGAASPLLNGCLLTVFSGLSVPLGGGAHKDYIGVIRYQL